MIGCKIRGERIGRDGIMMAFRDRPPGTYTKSTVSHIVVVVVMDDDDDCCCCCSLEGTRNNATNDCKMLSNDDEDDDDCVVVVLASPPQDSNPTYGGNNNNNNFSLSLSTCSTCGGAIVATSLAIWTPDKRVSASKLCKADEMRATISGAKGNNTKEDDDDDNEDDDPLVVAAVAAAVVVVVVMLDNKLAMASIDNCRTPSSSSTKACNMEGNSTDKCGNNNNMDAWWWWW